MKKILSIILLLLILLSCAKQTKQSEQNYKYLNEEKLLCYKNESDVGKLVREIPKESLLWLQFGARVEVLQEKEINKEKFLQFKQENSDALFWAKSSAFIDKFVVVLSDNIKVFNSPDESDDFPVSLRIGDYGSLIKESQDGFILVNFVGYHPYFLEGEQKYSLGKKWIKTNNKKDITKKDITNDSKIAREAYFLSWAYYYDKAKNDKKAAIKKLKTILSENTEKNQDSIITVIKEYLKKLENSAK